jgi:hypothetical protein
MEITSAIIITTERNGRKFQFILPVGAQYGEAYDAAFETLTEISKMSQKAAEQLKPAEAESDGSDAEVA